MPNPPIQHFWNAPANVVHVPGPTTVVVRSACGRTLNLPAWQVVEWQQKKNPVPSRDRICADCLDAVQSTEGEGATA